MIQLQEKVYSKNELADILGINAKDKNFKRNLVNTLTKWGYGFEFPPYSKTITITYVPEGENKLTEILVREYGIDIQVNAVEFACFLHAFTYIDGFVSMPWGEREEKLKEVYGIEVCDKTLRNWGNKLLAAGTLMKSDYDKTYWKSTKISDETTIREPASREEYIAYYKYKSEQYKTNLVNLISTGAEDFSAVKAEAYKQAHIAAMGKFGGWCYYTCKSLLLSAFDDKSLIEILEIVEEIAPYVASWKEKEDFEMKQKIKAEIERYKALAENSNQFYF